VSLTDDWVVDSVSTDQLSLGGIPTSMSKTTPDLPSPSEELGLPTPEDTPQPESQPEVQTQAHPPHEIIGDVDESNIIEGPRSRKPSSKRRAAYVAALNHVQDLSGYSQAFAVGLRHPRIHYNQLPPPPRNWSELQRHPHKEGFVKAAQTEYQAFQSKRTFREVQRADITAKIIP